MVMNMECTQEDHDIIKKGDRVRYLPRGTVFLVEDIYVDGAVGTFALPGGLLEERRAIIVLADDSGHYSVGKDIAKICPNCGKDILQEKVILASKE